MDGVNAPHTLIRLGVASAAARHTAAGVTTRDIIKARDARDAAIARSAISWFEVRLDSDYLRNVIIFVTISCVSQVATSSNPIPSVFEHC